MKISSLQGIAFCIRRESLSLYTCDLRNSVKRVDPKLAIDISILYHPNELKNAPKAVVANSLASGQTIFVARHQTKPIGYLSAATDRCWVGEVQDNLAVGPKEVYFFNAYTFTKFRGRRIYPALITHAAQYYKDRSYTRALIFTTATNTISLRGIEKAGFGCYENIYFHNLFGWKSWNHNRVNNDVQSRFCHEI